MKAELQEILDIDDVQGVLFFSQSGKMLYHAFRSPPPDSFVDFNWSAVVPRFSKIKEGELVFAHQRVYVRQSELGCLVVIMGWDATIAMVRLKSNAVLSL
ncbi:MAG: hypothetical protein ABIL58_21790 [Pseudomonadota bacterium]